MKKLTLILIFTAAIFAANAQMVTVLDSTIQNDMKLLIAADRIFTKNGLIEAIVNEASKEKAETGKIEKAQATQNFLDNIKADYQKYALKFIRVDTLRVNKDSINAEITRIQAWQTKVQNDPEIENVTTLSAWKRKAERLQKLLYYKRQFTN
jgi:hypothetical protein